MARGDALGTTQRIPLSFSSHIEDPKPLSAPCPKPTARFLRSIWMTRSNRSSWPNWVVYSMNDCQMENRCTRKKKTTRARNIYWCIFEHDRDHETRAKGSLVPPTRALNLAFSASSSEWTSATWTVNAINDAFWDCSAAAIAGKKKVYQAPRDTREISTIWS